MKEGPVSESASRVEGNSFFVNFILKPIKSGLYGFTAFFAVLILTKGVLYLFGFTEEYIVNSDDVLFSLLGLIIIFLLKLAENIKHKTAN